MGTNPSSVSMSHLEDRPRLINDCNSGDGFISVIRELVWEYEAHDVVVIRRRESYLETRYMKYCREIAPWPESSGCLKIILQQLDLVERLVHPNVVQKRAKTLSIAWRQVNSVGVLTRFFQGSSRPSILLYVMGGRTSA